MKQIKYKILIIVIIILISSAFFSLKNRSLPESVIDYKNMTINPVISFPNNTVDLSQGKENITYNELIAVTGKVIREWDIEGLEREIWYEPYIIKAADNNMLIKKYENIMDYEAEVNKTEAYEFFINFLESIGEDKYPKAFSLYKSEKINDSIIKAYTQGIIIDSFENINLTDPFTKGETLEVLNRILNPSERRIPFIIINNEENKTNVLDYNFPTGRFFSGDNIVSSFKIENLSNQNQDYWIEIVYIDSLGKEFKLPLFYEEILAEGSKEVKSTWVVPDEITSGHYHVTISIWDKNPEEINAKKMAHSEIPGLLLLYNKQEEFIEFNEELWKASTHTIGRTKFKKENVMIKNGNLNILMPADTFESGELQSTNLLSYGSYEIRMKLPDAPGSITGFFLYKAPDYYHEIDIEIYNQKSGDYFLTTYADGDKKNEIFGVFPFDPTKGYNNYRFDYYPDKLDYFVNDKFIVRFNKGYSKEEMYLMINSWYPHWVQGGPADNDKVFMADWIRY